jgi:hypothetical protein
MFKENKNLIEYIGLSNYLPTNLKVFKKATTSKVLNLPIYKAKIKQITKVSVDIQIIDTLLIDTVSGQSLDGLILTGKKLICYATVNYRIHYVSTEKIQTIQLCLIKVPLVESIIVKSSSREECNITTSIFIDDILCQTISDDKLFLYSSFIISCD